MNAEFYSYGGAEEVTGSKHFLEFKGQKIMVDCGAFQGRRQEAEEKNRNWPFNAAELDAMILSHAHFDHSGLIPVLPQKGYQGNIYATPATRDLASLIMMDSAHIQAKDIEFLKKRARKKGETFDKDPLYAETDVVNALDLFMTVSYHRPFYIADGVKATFYDAGHILGSALTYLELSHNGQQMKIGFSGDLGRNNLPILRDPEIIPDVDYLILESTYGNRLHDPIDQAMDKLAEIVNKTVKRGGKIIIPAFAIERTQELIYFLHLLVDQQKIPAIPIYVDSPMATNATSIFRVHQECYDQETRDAFLKHHKNPFGFNELRYTTSVEESKAINQLQEPAIIISSSGMCEAGRILHHLLNNIGDSRNTILIVGYMAQHTLGRKILEKQKEVRIFGDYHPLNAQVEELNSFSAHADYKEILTYVGKLNRQKLKRIFLVHGEPDAQQHLKSLLEENGFKVTIAKFGEKYQLQV
ncbi:MAG: MBL fold metallo-hydrolase [Calditrichia bacterium]